nr:response regulator [Chloroflexota bacterium]
MGESHDQPSVTVLVVDDEERIRKLVSLGLRRAGYGVMLASSGQEALARIAEAKPDLIVSDVMMPDMDGFALLSALREDPSTEAIPLIFLTAKGSTEDVMRGLGLGADDYLAKPFDMNELLARVRSKAERPPVPSEQLPRGRQTGLLSERVFWQEAEHELLRSQRSGRPGVLAYLHLVELPPLRERLGSRSIAQLIKEVIGLIEVDAHSLNLVGRDSEGRFLLLLPETDPRIARRWLKSLSERIAAQEFVVGEDRLTLTPAIGFAPFSADTSIDELHARALAAFEYAAEHLDLRPARYDPKVHVARARAAKLSWWRRLLVKLRLPTQVVPAPDVAVPAPRERPGATVLVVDDEERIRKLVSLGLRRAGYGVMLASSGQEALARIAEAKPDLIVSDVMMPDMDGFALLSALREDPSTEAIPLIFLTAKGSTEDVMRGLGLGADDYLAKPFDMNELLARVRSKAERPPVPSEQLPRGRQTGLLSERVFWQEAEHELLRSQRSGRPGVLAYLHLVELPPLRERLGSRSIAQLIKEVIGLIEVDAHSLNLVGRDSEGRFLLLLPETDPRIARRWLKSLSERIAAQEFVVGEDRLTLTPAIGFAPFSADTSIDELHARALAAFEYAAEHLDLRPARYDPKVHVARARAAKLSWWRRLLVKLRLPTQVAIVQLTPMVIPFLMYVTLYKFFGVDIASISYLTVVVALLVTAAFIWVEGFLALRPVAPPAEPAASYPFIVESNRRAISGPLEPPREIGVPFPPANPWRSITALLSSPDDSGGHYPPASAVIAAYLPNEAATVVETIEAFLRIEYPA